MKSQVNFVYDMEDDPQDEIKHWLFLENVRLQQVRQEMAEERLKLDTDKENFEKEQKSYKSALDIQEKKLLKQKELFEKQWQLMENELRRLARDKATLERERETLKRLQNQARTVTYSGESRFFAGVNTQSGLKKRYRELLKIFHPDNECGDETTVHEINQQYKNLKRKYGID